MDKHVTVALYLLCIIPRTSLAPMIKASGVQWSEPKGTGKGNITLIMIPQNSSAGNDSDMIVAVKSDYQILSQDTQLLNLVVNEKKGEGDPSDQCKSGLTEQELSIIKEGNNNSTRATNVSDNTVKNPDTANYFEPDKKTYPDIANKSAPVDIYPVLVKNYQDLVSANDSSTAGSVVGYSQVNLLELLNTPVDNSDQQKGLNDKALFNALSSNDSRTLNNLTVNSTARHFISTVRNDSGVVQEKSTNITVPLINSNDNFINEALNILENLKRDPSYYNNLSKDNRMTSVGEVKEQQYLPLSELNDKYLKLSDAALTADEIENQGKDAAQWFVNSNDISKFEGDSAGSVQTSTCIPFFMQSSSEETTSKLQDLSVQNRIAFESVPVGNNSLQNGSNGQLNTEKAFNIPNSSSISLFNENQVPNQAKSQSEEMSKIEGQGATLFGNLSSPSTDCVTSDNNVLHVTFPQLQQARMEFNGLFETTECSSQPTSEMSDLLQTTMEKVPIVNNYNPITFAPQQAGINAMDLLSHTINCASLRQLLDTFQQSKDESNGGFKIPTQNIPNVNSFNQISLGPKQAKAQSSEWMKPTINCAIFYNNANQVTQSPQQAKAGFNEAFKITTECATLPNHFIQEDSNIQKARIGSYSLPATTQCVDTLGLNSQPFVNPQINTMPQINIIANISNATVPNNIQPLNANNNIAGNVNTQCPPVVGARNQGPASIPIKITLEPLDKCGSLIRKLDATTPKMKSLDCRLKESDLALPLLESSVFLANNNDIPKEKDIRIMLNSLNASFDEMHLPDSQEQEDRTKEKLAELYNNNPLVSMDKGVEVNNFLKPLVVGDGQEMLNKRPSLIKSKMIYPDINQVLKMHLASKNVGLPQRLTKQNEQNHKEWHQTDEANITKQSSTLDFNGDEKQESLIKTTQEPIGNEQMQETKCTTKQPNFALSNDEDERIMTILNPVETVSQPTQIIEIDRSLAEKGCDKMLTSTGPDDDYSTKVVDISKANAKSMDSIDKTSTTAMSPFEQEHIQTGTNTRPNKTKSSKGRLNDKKSDSKFCLKNSENSKRIVIPSNSAQKIVIRIVPKSKTHSCKSYTFEENQNVAFEKNSQNEKKDTINKGYPNELSYKPDSVPSYIELKSLENTPVSLEKVHPSYTNDRHMETLKNDLNLRDEVVNHKYTDFEGQSNVMNVKEYVPPFLQNEISSDDFDSAPDITAVHSDKSLAANILKLLMDDKSEIKSK